MSPKTIKVYRDELRYFEDYLKHTEVRTNNQLTPVVIREYLLVLATHRNPGGSNMTYRVLKTITYWYEQETDGDYRSPMHKIKPPRVPVIPIQEIPLSNIERLISVCESASTRRNNAMLVVLLYTRVRANELI